MAAYLGNDASVADGGAESVTTKQYNAGTVNKFTETFKNTSKAVYAKATSVAFVQPGIIVVKGQMSLVKILLLSVIVGVIVALVAAYVAGYLALKKKKAAGVTSAEAEPAQAADVSAKEDKE